MYLALNFWDLRKENASVFFFIWGFDGAIFTFPISIIENMKVKSIHTAKLYKGWLHCSDPLKNSNDASRVYIATLGPEERLIL